MIGVFPSVFVLGLIASASLVLVASRELPLERVLERVAASRALVVATIFQTIHFTEEAATDLPGRLGAVLGLPAMPMSLFLSVNLIWIGIWVASVPGVRSAREGAFFAAWFLAIGGMVNLIAHPFLSILAGGYFPGLVSSPFVGIAGISLALRLRAASRQRS